LYTRARAHARTPPLHTHARTRTHTHTHHVVRVIRIFPLFCIKTVVNNKLLIAVK